MRRHSSATAVGEGGKMKLFRIHYSSWERTQEPLYKGVGMSLVSINPHQLHQLIAIL
jgi:hypothetical protein